MLRPTLKFTDGYPEVSPYLNGDVKTLQQFLQRWGFPVKPDGRFGPSTQAAVRSLQRKQGLRDDGVVGSRTWPVVTSPSATTSAGTGFSTSVAPQQTPLVTTGSGTRFFPLSKIYSQSWLTPMGRFGANRKTKNGGRRAHAGCDVYGPTGTWIHAITSGKVILGPAKFAYGTFQLAIDHGEFIARYCEIKAETTVRVGDSVQAGQRIARIGHLVGINPLSDMLHLELYKGTVSGEFNRFGAETLKRADGVPFNRRKDLFDGTEYVAQWRQNLPVD